jgi:hypothetical protein
MSILYFNRKFDGNSSCLLSKVLYLLNVTLRLTLESNFACRFNTTGQPAQSPTYGCTGEFSKASTYAYPLVTYSNGLSQNSSTLVFTISDTINAGGLNAYSIEVRYQSSQTSSLSAIAAGQTPLPASSNSTSHGSVSTVTDTLPAAGLSRGAKIGLGIGIGIPVLILILFIIGAFVLSRRRRKANIAESRVVGEDVEDNDNKIAANAHGNTQTGALNAGDFLPSLYMKPELEGSTVNRNRFEAQQAHELDMPVFAGPGPQLGSSQVQPTETVLNQQNSNQLGQTQTGDVITREENRQNLASPTPPGTQDGDETVEALEERLRKVKEKRETLAKLEEMHRMEEELERQIAAKRISKPA